MSMDIDEYLRMRDAMPTCIECGAATSGNITCRTCRQTNRVAHSQRGWPTDFLDRLDAAGVEASPPLDAEEVKVFMGMLEERK